MVKLVEPCAAVILPTGDGCRDFHCAAEDLSRLKLLCWGKRQTGFGRVTRHSARPSCARAIFVLCIVASVAGCAQSQIAPSGDCAFKISEPRQEEQKAPGELANAPSAYKPLSSHCKFELFLHQTYSPYTAASILFEATWAQAMAQWPQYGGGFQGWGKRLGATVADTESRRFIQGYVLSSAFHEDPRYFPSGKKGVIERAWYAATRVLVTRSESGLAELNRSEIFGALSTSSLQNAYYPRPCRTMGSTLDRFGGALASDATSDVLKEFTPDLKRLFQKHAPKKIQELEQRVPILAALW